MRVPSSAAALVLAASMLASCAAAAPVPGQGQVVIPEGDVSLLADYVRPDGPARAPAVVALHGCGGPWPRRDGQWRDLLVQNGHPVLLPDSFGSRGLGSQCTTPNRAVTPGTARRADTVAAAAWLAGQDGTPPGGLVVMGWSNGGSTVLAAAREGVMPPGLVRGYVAFYPGCTFYEERSAWKPAGPLLIVMGEDDDWTPAAPCRALAARFPEQITLVLYPGAYHDFDAPNLPIRERRGLAFTANRNGLAHTGTNPAAREAALKLVPEWIAGLAPVSLR